MRIVGNTERVTGVDGPFIPFIMTMRPNKKNVLIFAPSHFAAQARRIKEGIGAKPNSIEIWGAIRQDIKRVEMRHGPHTIAGIEESEELTPAQKAMVVRSIKRFAKELLPFAGGNYKLHYDLGPGGRASPAKFPFHGATLEEIIAHRGRLTIWQ
jgi:hypothetical protein